MSTTTRTPMPPRGPTPRHHRIQRRFDGTRPVCEVVRSLVAAHTT